MEDNNIKIVHMDSTGAFVRKPYDCTQIQYYCIVCRLKESVFPAAEMITSQHNTPSISTFLKYYRFFVQDSFKNNNNVWPLFKGIVVDCSWATMNSILIEWNEIKQKFLLTMNL